MAAPSRESLDYNRTAAVVAGLASGAALALGTGLEPWWPLAWLAPLPALAAAYRLPKWPAAALAFGAWVLGAMPMGAFLYRSLRAPLLVVLVVVVIPAIVFALVVVVSRALLRRGSPWAAALAVPALWVSFELLVARVSPHGSAGSLAYSQAELLPLVQLVSVTGLSGVTFLLLALPAAVAVSSSRAVTSGRRWGLLGTATFLVVAALAFGSWRLGRPTDGETLAVGLAASDADIGLYQTTDARQALPVIDAYAGAVDALAARGARIVVLPEKFVGVTDSYRPEAERRLAAAAARNRVTVVAGLNEIVAPLKRNIAVVFAEDGTIRGRYLKRHYIPGVEEGYAVGRSPVLVSTPTATWGVAICKDLDFPAFGRRYARRGVALMVAPSWDFVVDRWWHERMAAMRAVEGGYALARTARQGLLTVRDNRGRLVAAARSDEAPMSLLAAKVRVRHDATVYARYGDWFAWLCVSAAAVLLGRLATKENAWKATD